MKILLPLIILLFSYNVFAQSVIYPVEVRKPFRFDRSINLRNIEGIDPGNIDRSWKDVIPNKFGFDRNDFRETDKSKQIINEENIQKIMGTESTSSISVNFDAIPNLDGYLPPDTQGDVGLNHYVQVVNSSFQIFDKSGNSVYGPFALGTIWTGFTGPWETSLNDGDPIVLYDQAADRWLISEFSLPNYPKGPYYELIAISTTSDPTGEWYRYAYEYSDMPDYPKFGIWNDGYYMATNNFFRAALFTGAGASCFERDEMLVGNPDARLIYINVADVPNGSEAGGMLPADWDGVTPPPAGTPNYFVYFNDGVSNDNLRVWEFSVDWDNPTNSTFTLNTTLNTELFDSNVGTIEQPSTTQGLDALDDRLMYRLQYRNFGDYEAMVTNHTVDANGVAGIKWYEIRNEGSGWNIYQEATFSPDDTERWMGSIALDGSGNIALGYSVSSSTVYPSIRYTGRYKNDPLGEMTITETDIVTGNGIQTHSSGRWGDYSMMSIDPIDDQTFWYTTEYMPATSSGSWQTRVAAFTLGSSSILDIKVIIQAAYNSSTSSMMNEINQFIPLTSPYTEDPASVTSISTDIIDWVLVQFTETAEGAPVLSKSALLKNNGKLIDPDTGLEQISVSLTAGDYFIKVKHRNHMRIMSASSVSIQ